MFTVIWRDRALNRLADFYVAVDPPTRERIADGVASLNKRLAVDPENEGESRNGIYRLTFVDRLAISFGIDRTRGVVRVLWVTRHGRS